MPALKEPPGRDSESFYRSILEGIVDGVWVADKTDTIIYANRGMGVIAGIPPEKIQGARALKDFPEETLKYFKPHYISAKTKLKPVPYDAIPVVTPAGRESYQSGRLIPLLKDGEYDGMICTVQDVTRRKDDEEKIRKAVRIANAAEVTANIGSWSWSPAANEVIWSDNLHRLHGIEPGEFGGTWENAVKFIHPGDIEAVTQRSGEMLAEKKPMLFEYRIVTAAGVEKFVQGTNRIIFDDHGEISEIIGTVQDITATKRTEAELKKYAKTQSVLVREVNHRVKNNLTALISMVHMEEAKAESLGSTAYLPLLSDFLGRIKGLSAVHGMLTDSGWRPLELKELCRGLVTSAVGAMASGETVDIAASPAGIKINSAQAHHLAMVLNELAANSVKYAFGRNGKPGRITVDIRELENEVTIRFGDNGPGYPEEILHGDFSRAGTGMELINGIVGHSLGGDVRFDNGNGAVTTIIFENETNE